MDPKIIAKIETSQLRKRPEVKVGDTVKLSMKIKEGDKERTQVFEGVVIQISGSGINSTLTVRKISNGVGVERIVPVHAPTLDKIEVIKRGTVRKSKLYYMRDRIGKKAMKVTGIKDLYLTDEVEQPKTEVKVDENTEVTTQTDSTK